MPEYSSLLNDHVPGPYARVTLRNEGEFRDMKALVETGADQTFVPNLTVEALNLQLISDDLEIHDASGGKRAGSLYLAHVELEGFTFPDLPVAGSDLDVVIIGRDILNDFVATFDGPSLRFGLEKP